MGVPECAKPVLLEMLLHVLFSHLLLVAQDILVLWSVWDKKIPMLVMKLNPKEVSLPCNTQLNTVLLPTGMIWKKSGIILSTPQLCTLLSKLFFPCMHLEEPPVLFWILVMVFPIPSQFMKVMLFLMLSFVWILLDVI